MEKEGFLSLTVENLTRPPTTTHVPFGRFLPILRTHYSLLSSLTCQLLPCITLILTDVSSQNSIVSQILFHAFSKWHIKGEMNAPVDTQPHYVTLTDEWSVICHG
ncbi:hypothetical protein ACMYSQ_008683 [Aspergillus niger]